MKSGSSTKIVIDRIEGDLAVLALYDDDRVKFSLPLERLPEGSREGDHLQMGFTQDEASRESEQEKVQNLLNELRRT